MTGAEDRELLEAVARGEISPEEATDLLEGLRAGRQAPPELPPADDDLRRDQHLPLPRVTLTVNGTQGIDIRGSDEIERVSLEGPGRCVGLDDSFGAGESRTLCEVGTGAVVLVPRPVDLDLRVNGGYALITGMAGAISAVLNVGHLLLGLSPDADSQIIANCGKVDLVLTPTSDVSIVVKAPTQITVADPRILAVGRGRYRLGEGRVDLEIDGNMGLVTLGVR